MSALDDILRIPPHETRERAIWYQVTYNLAAHQAHSALATDASRVQQHARQGLLDDARYTAARLLATAATTLTEIEAAGRRRRWWWERHRLPDAQDQLQAFLSETTEPSSAILFAGLIIETTRPLETETADDSLEISNRSELPNIATRVIRQEMSSSPDAVSSALVEYALTRPTISYRVHYNAACYFSGLTPQSPPRDSVDNGRIALQELENALHDAPASERRALTKWTESDPSLEQLRRFRTASFRRLLGMYKLPDLEQRRQKATTASAGVA
jgi:hypothetical protein